MVSRAGPDAPDKEARYVSGASLLVDGGWAVTGYPDMRPFRPAPAWPRKG
jgi:hypothetical protein